MCVGVCVPKSHLTSRACVCHENTATYSVGNEGQKSSGVFSENFPLQRLRAPSLDGHTSDLLYIQKTRMHIVGTQILATRTIHDVKLPTRFP